MDLTPREKLDPELKARWLEALRSGEHKRGEGALCEVDDDGVTRHCCLGVLRELVPELKEAVSAGAGLLQGPSNALVLLAYEVQTSLAGLNDEGEGDGYESVIPFIEKEL